MRWLMVALVVVLAACADSGGDSTRTTNETRSSPVADAGATETRAVEQTEIAGVRSGGASTQQSTTAGSTATYAATAAPTTPATTATATVPKATPTPDAVADVAVGKWRSYLPEYSKMMRVVGDVVNNGTGIATDVQVAITMYDAAGTIIGSGEAIYILPMIPAGGKSPFIATIDGADPALVADTKFQVQFENYDPDAFMAGFYSIDLAVNQVSWSGDTLVGEVQNTGDKTLEGVAVIAISYDAAGEVHGVYQTYVSLDQIAPGDTSPFSASYLGVEGDPATVEAFAYGRPVD